MSPSVARLTVLDDSGFSVPLHSSPVSTAAVGTYRGYDHITWYVGNAKQAASYYVTRMGFKLVAKRTLETGSRYIAAYVVSNGAATFNLISPMRSLAVPHEDIPPAEGALLRELHLHLEKHGDGVKGVAFEVDNVRAVHKQAVAKGAISVEDPIVLTDGNHGTLLKATIKTFGDTTHTLLERREYTGPFLPGYQAVTRDDPLSKFLPAVPLDTIDHCVGNQDWDGLKSTCE